MLSISRDTATALIANCEFDHVAGPFMTGSVVKRAPTVENVAAAIETKKTRPPSRTRRSIN
jgi:hypothetical protein